MNDAPEPTDVVIVGAGPTGLMLAIELCLGGVTPVVLERLPEISEIPKGNGFFGLIVPVLDYRGLLEPLRAEATYAGPVPRFFFGPLPLDFPAQSPSPLQVLAAPQRTIERKLAERLAELGGIVRRGHELTGLTRQGDAVTIEVTGPDGDYQLRTRYLAGCDGAHSGVRKLAGIEFPGVTTDTIARIGRVRVPAGLIVAGTGELDVPGAGRLRMMQPVRTAHGSYSIAPQASVDKTSPRDVYIVSTQEEQPDADLTAPMTLEELADSVRRVIGTDLPMSDPIWLTRLGSNSRQADRYRDGPIMLAGDAAHVFGVGGSLNAGLLDALNLGWKLAAQVRGGAPEGLLESYHAERHAAGQRALLQSRAQRALSRGDVYAQAARELMGELLQFPEPARHVGELIAGSDVRYDMSGSGQPGHPLTGRLAPDLRLAAPHGQTSVAELMRAARPVLLDFTHDGRVAAAAGDWNGSVTVLVTQRPNFGASRADAQRGIRRIPDRIRRAVVSPATLMAKPLTGATAADALLIRPDGYVAWASGPSATEPERGLDSALRTWCPTT
jgi:2-polyprenyl-6-methoxyphenol hydroxylase-like FAD-dependent oxidoreductase